MPIVWMAEVPDSTPNSGTNIKIAVDSAFNVHLAYVVNNQLTYAIGKPHATLRGPAAGLATISTAYQWTFHEVPTPTWVATFPLDLAVDSQNRAHLCFPWKEPEDAHESVMHAVWDDSKFVQVKVGAPHLGWDHAGNVIGLAMTIDTNDSVHVAYSDFERVTYSSRAGNARDSDDFQVTEPVDDRTLGLSEVMFGLSIAVGSGGQIGISYIVGREDELLGANHHELIYAERLLEGGVFRWPLEIAHPSPMIFDTITPPGGLGVFLQQGTNSLVIDGNGVPHIAYFNGELRYLTRPGGLNNWAVSGTGLGELVDPWGQSSPAKILLDHDNALHIAYQATVPAGTTELRYATQESPGVWGTARIDPSINCGWAISAAMDRGGQPHIAYGFIPVVNGGIVLKHTFALNLTPIPLFPHKKGPKGPILKRPS